MDQLAGDSLHQRSLDMTQAGTDLAQNSTILPSILPAMNSIQSNDITNEEAIGKSDGGFQCCQKQFILTKNGRATKQGKWWTVYDDFKDDFSIRCTYFLAIDKWVAS